MWQAVAQIMDDYERDDAIRVIVVSGAGGRAFVSGADISEFKERRASEEAAAAYAKISEGARMRLQDTLKPTIAMIRGYCIGGGVGTALACDMRIAAEGSKFGIPAAKLGLGYAYDGIKKLIDLVGPAYAREIFFTARQFTAEEALRMGLVNQVVPDGKLEGYVKNYCNMIAGNAPLTVRAAKADRARGAEGRVDARLGIVQARRRRMLRQRRIMPKAAPPSWKSANRCSRGADRACPFSVALSLHGAIVIASAAKRSRTRPVNRGIAASLRSSQ